jgi:uncharacterized membrane protein YeaQ/YmgE (transglycosylase-associated protein family)
VRRAEAPAHAAAKESDMMHYLWMFIVGLVVGAIARFIMPGAEHMGIIMTGVLGIVGSFVGGFIARLFSKPAPGAPFHPAGIVLSIVGALIVLWLCNRLSL